MFWNKKEDNGLPDLPPVRFPQHSSDIPSMHDEHDEGDEPVEKHGLPSFPDSPIQRGFSQAAIKDAISTDAIVEERPMPQPMQQPHRTFKSVEMDNWSSGQQVFAPPPVERPMFKIPREKNTDRNNDVFVRIDKFYSARKALETTKDKLNEIDELLRKIRETKLREEQELNAWEKELAEVKSRVQDVVENIFEKVE